MSRPPGPRAPMPVLLTVAASALLAACSNDPLSYIPSQDRAILQAQHRLGDGGATGGPISVEALLNQARGGQSAGPADAANRVALRYEGDTIQPTAEQRDIISRFGAQAREQGLSVTVVSRKDSFDNPGAPLLGQRRATAVARALEGVVQDVDLRFETGAPPGVVVLSGGRRNSPS